MIAPLALPLLLAQDPATLTGRLVHADGTPVAHAAVELFAAPADPELAATWSPPAAIAAALVAAAGSAGAPADRASATSAAASTFGASSATTWPRSDRSRVWAATIVE